jgi:predicted N-acyltransferase
MTAMTSRPVDSARASDLKVTFHDSLDELPEWNDVAAVGGFYSSAEWTRMTLLTDPVAPTFIAIRQGEQTLAVASCYLAPAPGKLSGLTDPFHLVADVAPAEQLTPLMYPVLVCGAARGYSSRLLIRDGLSADLRAAVVARLLAAARELGEQRGAKLVAFNHLPARDATELVAVDPALRPAFAEAYIVLSFDSFDAYLAALSTRGRWNRNRELKLFGEHGMRLEWRRFGEVFEPVRDLFIEQYRKWDSSETLEESRAFYRPWLSSGFDDRTRVVCAMQDDRLMGAALFIAHGDTYYTRDFGTHPEAPRAAAVYFNCLYNESIRMAAAEGMKHVDYGIRSIESKIQRGGRATGLWFVLDPRTPWPAEVTEGTAVAARARLARDAATLGKYRDDAMVRSELEFDAAEALLASFTRAD